MTKAKLKQNVKNEYLFDRQGGNDKDGQESVTNRLRDSS
jgi:hypothetical protein